MAVTSAARKAKLTPVRVQFRMRWGSRSVSSAVSESVPRAASAPTAKNAATDRAMKSRPCARPRKTTAKTLVPTSTTPGPELNPNVTSASTPVENASPIASQARGATARPGSRRSAGKARPEAPSSRIFGHECCAERADSEITTMIGATTAATLSIPRRTSCRHDSRPSSEEAIGSTALTLTAFRSPELCSWARTCASPSAPEVSVRGRAMRAGPTGGSRPGVPAKGRGNRALKISAPAV